MIPPESEEKVKAREFIMKFYKYAESDPVKSDFHHEYGADATKFSNAKQCALIAVNEILDNYEKDDENNDDCHWANSREVHNWDKLKESINTY